MQACTIRLLAKPDSAGLARGTQGKYTCGTVAVDYYYSESASNRNATATGRC